MKAGSRKEQSKGARAVVVRHSMIFAPTYLPTYAHLTLTAPAPMRRAAFRVSLPCKKHGLVPSGGQGLFYSVEVSRYEA